MKRTEKETKGEDRGAGLGRGGREMVLRRGQKRREEKGKVSLIHMYERRWGTGDRGEEGEEGEGGEVTEVE